ncbi:unnamed protein product [Dovyalis caffra]|uniref:Uncharacterized protein n=1 Tax=Dovyalis caffra TaxID=77055 RepID=A0AAV1RAR0_9ROSI|nr:unnamed protein product [Dovyalis caffra]
MLRDTMISWKTQMRRFPKILVFNVHVRKHYWWHLKYLPPLVAEPGDAVSTLNYGAHEESCLGNVALESHSPHLQERDRGAENSYLSSDRVKVIESSCHKSAMLLDQMTVQELCKVFCRIFGHETSVIDKQWLIHHIPCGMQSHCKLVNGLNMFESLNTSKVSGEKPIVLSPRASSGTAPDSFKDILDSQHTSGDKHVKKEKLASCNSLKMLPSLVGEVGCCSMGKTNAEEVLVTQRTMNKPTRSFTQAARLQTSRYSYRKYGPSDRNLRGKFLDVRSHKKYHQKGPGATQIVCQEESLKASSLQVSSGLPLQKRKPKKYTSYLGYDSRDSKENGVSVSNEDFDTEPSSVKSQDCISEDDCVTSSTQRGRKLKRDHRRWTLGEVRKLIIGVTEHGVGKWTHIKRLMFSSSHRTSVNLKDKWRNLLNSSTRALRKSKVQQESNQLPESVLCQVRELAIIYAYPRKNKPSMSCTA